MDNNNSLLLFILTILTVLFIFSNSMILLPHNYPLISSACYDVLGYYSLAGNPRAKS